MLLNRDYTIIIDKSGSMYTKDKTGGKSRWVPHARIDDRIGE